MMGIGTKLEKLLEDRQLTVAELSRLSGVPQTTIYSVIQRNSKKIDINALISISKQLGVAPEYFGDDVQPSRPEVCESLALCQGAAHEAVQMLLRLDRDDLLIIQGELRAMLRAEKYQGAEKANEAPA